MRNKLVLTFLLSSLILSGCSFGKHKHDWGKYVDFDEEYHYRVCEEDKSHILKEKHTYFSKGQYLDYDYLEEFECSGCHRKKVESNKLNAEFTECVAEPKYLYKVISDATSIYYKSDSLGNFGNPKCIFLKTILPDEYEECRYIESMGGNYIDTGIKMETGDTIVSKYDDYGGVLFGSYDTVSPKHSYILHTSSNRDTAFTPNIQIEETTVGENRKLFLKNIDVMKYGTLGIFGVSASLLTFTGAGRFYTFKYYRGDELLHNYIPCARILDKKAGFYDLIDKKFYFTNNRTDLGCGDFISEDLIDEKYYKTEYTEAYGDQYLKAGVDFTSKTKIDTEISFGAHPSYNFMFGKWSAGTSFSMFTDNKICASNGMGNSHDVINGTLNRFEKIHVFTDMQTGITINDIFYPMGSGIPPASNAEIYLFATNETPIPAKNYYQKFGIGRIYSFKIYDGDELIRDFVPVVRAEDFKCGFYDNVEKKFYQNEAPACNTLEEGEKVEGSTRLPEGYTELSYIQTNGTQYFDTGLISDFSKDAFEITAQATQTDQDSFLLGSFPQFYNANYHFLYYSHCDNEISLTIRTNDNYTVQLQTDLKGNDLDKHTYYYEKSQLYVDYKQTDGTLRTNFMKYSWYTSLMGIYEYSFEVSRNFIGKFYSCRYYQNGILKRDYVPCINPDGICGIYDLASKTFTADQNSGFHTFKSGVGINEFEYSRTIIEPTYSHPGLDEYKSIYNDEIKMVETDPLAFEVTFDCDNSYVEILERDEIENKVLTNTAYSINEYSLNYSINYAQVSFIPTAKPSYKIKDIKIADGYAILQKAQDRYYLKKISSNLKVSIITELV